MFGSLSISTDTTFGTDTESASAITGRFPGCSTSNRTFAPFGNKAPRQRLGRNAAIAVNAKTSDPIGKIGPCAE